MRPGSLAILAIAAYSTFLLATMPARWVEPHLAAAVAGRYTVQAVNGTVWKGDAQATLGLGAGRFTIDRLEWDFLPSRLLQGRLAYALSLRGAGFEARYEAGRSLAGWSVRDLAARGEASLVAAALPWIANWRPEGKVSATASRIDIAGNQVRGEMRVEVSGASTALAEVRPLGSYRGDIVAEGPAARLVVSTLEGALRLAGTGRIELPGRFSFSGEARAEGPNARALDPLLNLLGPARPDGSRALEWRTR